MTPEPYGTLALVLGIAAFWLIGGVVVIVRQARRIARGTRERRDDLPYRMPAKR